jgi:hypothetical protein
MPTLHGFVSKQIILDSALNTLLTNAFAKVNADNSPDMQAAAKSALIAKRLRRV